MKFDMSQAATTVDRLATAEEIVMAILQSPGMIDELSAEILRRGPACPSDVVPIPDSEFEFLSWNEQLPHKDSILN
jgi:hypothetical protein